MNLTYVVKTVNGTTGLERMILFQANYFTENLNYKIDIILLDQKKNKKNNFELNDKISFHHLNTSKKRKINYFLKVYKINKKLDDLKPNIVIVCLDEVFGLYLGYFIKKGYPSIYQRHTTSNLNLNIQSKSLVIYLVNTFKKYLIGKSGGGYDRFVVLSKEHIKDWPHLSNIRVISNPITIETGKDIASLDNKIVIAVGRHSFVKGYDMLLKSWQKVIKDFPDWSLNIYGKLDNRLKLNELSEKLEVDKNVNFYNHTKDIKNKYLESSVLVSSSRIEGFPLVIIEAMALGLPVVSFDCPVGPRAIIKNKEDGFLVFPGDINLLADSIKKIIENKGLRNEMGKNARRNIQRFSPEIIMNQWKELIEELILQLN